jgi:DNA-binding transcriptional ArsR family regulator
MKSNKDILALDTRKKIYDIILKNPGLHLRELGRKTEIPLATLRYHLNFLTKKGIIITKSDHRYSRYYVKHSVASKDKEIINLLRQDIPLRIILLLLSPGPGDIYMNEETKQIASEEPTFFLKTHSKKELVELTKYWKGPYGGLFNLNKHRTTIDFHLKKLLDADLIDKIKVGKEFKYRLKSEESIWIFLFENKESISNETIDVYLSWHDSLGNDGFFQKRMDLTMEIIYDVFPHPYHV